VHSKQPLEQVTASATGMPPEPEAEAAKRRNPMILGAHAGVLRLAALTWDAPSATVARPDYGNFTAPHCPTVLLDYYAMWKA
jgi:hypothetical protein